MGQADRAVELFLCMFKIGAFTFGGGHVMIPVIKHEMVDRRDWLSEAEFMDLLAVVQGSPGPIAVNLAVVTGYHLAGPVGSAAAALGAALPSFMVILAIVSLLITDTAQHTIAAVLRGVKPAVTGLILAAAWRLGHRLWTRPLSTVVMCGSFLALVLLAWHPVMILLLAGAAAIVLGFKGEDA